MYEIVIPSQLKFLMSNIESVINIQLTPDNYPLWRSQISKLFATDGFEGYLNGTKIKPEKQISDESNNIIFYPNFNI